MVADESIATDAMAADTVVFACCVMIVAYIPKLRWDSTDIHPRPEFQSQKSQ